MKKTLEEITQRRQELMDIEVPEATSTYEPISADLIFTIIETICGELKLDIVNEEHFTYKNGKQQRFHFYIGSELYPQFHREIIVLNSYDKSISLRAVSGISVALCSNGMTIGDVKIWNKHTSGIVTEFVKFIEITFKDFENGLKGASDLKKLFESIDLTHKQVCYLVGKAFMEGIISPNDVSAVKTEFQKHSFPYEGSQSSLWFIYNVFTHVLKSTHATKYVKKRILIEQMFGTYAAEVSTTQRVTTEFENH